MTVDIKAARHREAAVRRRKWKAALAAISDLVFPPACASCGSPNLDSGRALLCADCRGILLKNQRPRCARCCRPISEFSLVCAQCTSTGRLAYSAGVCVGAYAEQLRETVLRSKKASELPVTAALAELLCEVRGETLRGWQVDGVAAMPMHWLRRLGRGVNGPQLIAERLSRTLSASDWSGVLVRRRNTPPQASLPPSARLANVRGAFRVRRGRRIRGKRVLLVDDVMTTGATCQEAAATLLRAGASEVFVAVIARSDS